MAKYTSKRIAAVSLLYYWFLLWTRIDSFAFVPTAPSFEIDSERAYFNQRADVTCIGEVLYDCIADADCSGLLFAEVEAQGKWQKYPGGAPANVACALSRLGVRSLFAGAVGDDEEGTDLVKLLIESKVETLCTTANYPTRKVLVTRNDDGDRTFSGFFGGARTEFFADCHYTPPVSSRWLVENSALAVVMGTLGLYPSSSATAKLMRAVKTDIIRKRNQRLKSGEGNAARGGSLSGVVNPADAPLLVVDLNVRDSFWGNTDTQDMRDQIIEFAQHADIIKLTDEEAEWAFGVTQDEALQQPELLAPLLEPTVGLLVTGGERGASYYLKGVGSSYRPAHKVKVVDTTGAGDAFTAGFLAGYAMDKSTALTTDEGANRALDIACVAGALTCTKPGAIASQPSLDQVIAELLNQ